MPSCTLSRRHTYDGSPLVKFLHILAEFEEQAAPGPQAVGSEPDGLPV